MIAPKPIAGQTSAPPMLCQEYFSIKISRDFLKKTTV
jgi:hypothetical protein